MASHFRSVSEAKLIRQNKPLLDDQKEDLIVRHLQQFVFIPFHYYMELIDINHDEVLMQLKGQSPLCKSFIQIWYSTN